MLKKLIFCKGKLFNLPADQLLTPTTNKLSLLDWRYGKIYYHNLLFP